MGAPTVWDEDVQAFVHGAALADITATASSTYGATEQGMLNDLKARVNSIIAALESAGILAQD